MTLRKIALFLAFACPGVAVIAVALKSAGSAVKDWPTLISWMVAIAAALIGGAFIHEQIAAAHRLEEEKRQRYFAAARAVLPLTLSKVTDFAAANAKALLFVYGKRVGEEIPSTVAVEAFPTLSPIVVQEFRGTIEHADKETYRAIADLLAILQIIEARLATLKSEIGREDHVAIVLNIESYIMDCAEAHARAGLMFDFARRRSDAIGVTPDLKSITNSLLQFGLRPEEYERIYQLAEWRFGGGGKRPILIPPAAKVATA